MFDETVGVGGLVSIELAEFLGLQDSGVVVVFKVTLLWQT